MFLFNGAATECCLPCSDGVGWVTGRASGQTSVSKPLGMVVNVSGQGAAGGTMWVRRISAYPIRMLRIRILRVKGGTGESKDASNNIAATSSSQRLLLDAMLR